MDITFSRRIAKIMMSESMIDAGIRKRAEFVGNISKYRNFEDLPLELQLLITSIEKAEGWESGASQND